MESREILGFRALFRRARKPTGKRSLKGRFRKLLRRLCEGRGLARQTREFAARSVPVEDGLSTACSVSLIMSQHSLSVAPLGANEVGSGAHNLCPWGVLGHWPTSSEWHLGAGQAGAAWDAKRNRLLAHGKSFAPASEFRSVEAGPSIPASSAGSSRPTRPATAPSSS